jgi:Spy/CpxP family protein refolding chaperone
VLQAQAEDAPASPPTAAAKKERPKVDRAQQLQKELNLTDEQAAKVKELDKWRAEEGKKLGKEASKEQRQELRKQYTEKFNAVLTAEQQAELAKQRKEWGREGREKKAHEHHAAPAQD